MRFWPICELNCCFGVEKSKQMEAGIEFEVFRHWQAEKIENFKISNSPIKSEVAPLRIDKYAPVREPRRKGTRKGTGQ